MDILKDSTARPWKLGDIDEHTPGFTDQDIYSGEYCSSSYKSVAHVQAEFDGEAAPEMTVTDIANAELIVRAVNSHEAIVSALEELLDAQKELSEHPENDSTKRFDEKLYRVEIAEAAAKTALSLAKGGE